MSSDAIDKTMEGIESELMQGLADKAVEAEAKLPDEDVLVGPAPEPEPEPDPFGKMAQKFWDSWEPSEGCITLEDFVFGEIAAAERAGEIVYPSDVREMLAKSGIRAWGTNMHVTTEITKDVWTNAHMWSWDPNRSLLWRRTDDPPLWLKVQVQPPEPPVDADFEAARGGILESALGDIGRLARAIDKLVEEVRAERIERTAAMKDFVDRLKPALDKWLKAKTKEQS